MSHSGYQIQRQCYLQDTMPCQWSIGDLSRVLRIWKSAFYSLAFFNSFLLFQIFPGAGSSTSKLAESRDMTRPRPDYLFEWHQSKRFLWGRFFIRARAGQSQSVNLHRELVLQNIIFEMFASYKIWTLFTIAEHVTSHNR